MTLKDKVIRKPLGVMCTLKSFLSFFLSFLLACQLLPNKVMSKIKTMSKLPSQVSLSNHEETGMDDRSTSPANQYSPEYNTVIRCHTIHGGENMQVSLSNHEETGMDDRSTSPANQYSPEFKDDVSINLNDCFLTGCVESKSSRSETKPLQQSASCHTIHSGENMQFQEPTLADNVPDDVVVVRNSAMGPYPMSLLAAGSPMNKSITSSASGSICRICLEGDCIEELISPCDCMGSMSVVHICCLEKWLSTSNLDRCEVCKFQFKVKRTPRPIIQWLFSRQSCDGPHGFCGDALCLIILTPICLTSVYLCGMGALAYLQRRAWEGVGLAFLSFIVLFTFFLWGFTTVRFQWQSMNRWRMTNQTVHLVDHAKARRRRQPGTALCNAHRTPALPSHI